MDIIPFEFVLIPVRPHGCGMGYLNNQAPSQQRPRPRMASQKGTNIMAKSKKAIEHKPIPENEKQKKQALDRALTQIDQAFGKGSIMRLDEESYNAVPGISTGALSLDLALGGKGIPRGRIVEIFGPESSGKTTLSLTVLANAQKKGGVAAFIDAEHALDPTWARKIGVNIDDLLVSQPDTGEQALEICELLVVDLKV